MRKKQLQAASGLSLYGVSGHGIFVQSSASSAEEIRRRQACRTLQSCRLAEAGQMPPRALQAALLQRLAAASTSGFTQHVHDLLAVRGDVGLALGAEDRSNCAYCAGAGILPPQR